MNRVMMTGLLFVMGCGAIPLDVPTEREVPESVVPPVFVEVPVPFPVPVFIPSLTNMDVLRATCWYMTDSRILNGVFIIDDHWWAGISYFEQLDITAEVCELDFNCLDCWDAITDFVYFVAH